MKGHVRDIQRIVFSLIWSEKRGGEWGRRGARLWGDRDFPGEDGTSVQFNKAKIIQATANNNQLVVKAAGTPPGSRMLGWDYLLEATFELANASRSELHALAAEVTDNATRVSDAFVTMTIRHDQ